MLKTTTGGQFSGVVYKELPPVKEERRKAIYEAVSACDACAILVVEQLEHDVRAIFESTHGTRTWRLPIKEHGDVQILGRATAHDNADSIGALWHAN